MHHLDDNIQARAGRRGDQAGQGGHDAKDDQVAVQSQRSCLHLNNLMLKGFRVVLMFLYGNEKLKSNFMMSV